MSSTGTADGELPHLLQDPLDLGGDVSDHTYRHKGTILPVHPVDQRRNRLEHYLRSTYSGHVRTQSQRVRCE